MNLDYSGKHVIWQNCQIYNTRHISKKIIYIWQSYLFGLYLWFCLRYGSQDVLNSQKNTKTFYSH